MSEHGIIKSRKFVRQIRNFSGLQWGSITPTDIDGAIDFGNRAFVVIETKFADSELPDGQRLAIERFVDAWEIAKKKAMGIIARHNCAENQDIIVAHCIVTELRLHGKWIPLKKPATVRQIINRFLEKHGLAG